MSEGKLKKIKRNAIQCRKCREIIESTSIHDFEWCSCGNCAVDGGTSYLKRAFRTDDPDDAFVEMAEYE